MYNYVVKVVRLTLIIIFSCYNGVIIYLNKIYAVNVIKLLLDNHRKKNIVRTRERRVRISTTSSFHIM